MSQKQDLINSVNEFSQEERSLVGLPTSSTDVGQKIILLLVMNMDLFRYLLHWYEYFPQIADEAMTKVRESDNAQELFDVALQEAGQLRNIIEIQSTAVKNEQQVGGDDSIHEVNGDLDHIDHINIPILTVQLSYEERGFFLEQIVLINDQ